MCLSKLVIPLEMKRMAERKKTCINFLTWYQFFISVSKVLLLCWLKLLSFSYKFEVLPRSHLLLDRPAVICSSQEYDIIIPFLFYYFVWKKKLFYMYVGKLTMCCFRKHLTFAVTGCWRPGSWKSSYDQCSNERRSSSGIRVFRPGFYCLQVASIHISPSAEKEQGDYQSALTIFLTCAV